MGNICCVGGDESMKSRALLFVEEDEEENLREKERASMREEKVRVAGSMKLKRLHTIASSKNHRSTCKFVDIGTNEYLKQDDRNEVVTGEAKQNASEMSRVKSTDCIVKFGSRTPNPVVSNSLDTRGGTRDLFPDLPSVPAQTKRPQRKKGHRYQRSSPAALENWKVAATKVVKFVQHHRTKFTSAPLMVEKNWTCPTFEKSNHVIEFLHSALIENFLFDSLDEPTRHTIVMSMKPVSVRVGTAIYCQGDIADGFYVVEKGQVKIFEKNTATAVHGVGCSFGEMSLLYNFPRPVTVIAIADCQLWKLDQHTFKSLLAEFNQDDEESILKTLEKVQFLKCLSPEKKHNLANALTSIEFLANDKIMIKGDIGKVLYIIKKGMVKLHDIGHGQSTFDDITLCRGEFFGERALLTGGTRVANATALSDCTVLAISYDVLKAVVGSLQPALSSGSRLNFLRAIPQLANFNVDELVFMQKKMTATTFHPGEEVPCHDLYEILSGRMFISDENGSLFKLEQGDYFGNLLMETSSAEEEKKEEESSVASTTITVDEVTKCLRLRAEDVISAVGNDYMSRLGKYKPHSDCIEYNNFKLRDLKKHRMIGKGAYGKVWLVSNITHKNKTGSDLETGMNHYALKMVSKRPLLDMKLVPHIIREKNIMASIQHPFVLSLISSFQDADYLYFVLPLSQGGDLYAILHQRENSMGEIAGLPLADTRFYSAVIIEALSYMHERNIVYRDLKPENVLIDADGYGVVADLGFAKVVPDQTYTICGTPEYIAPEIIVSKGHNCVADYWSLGCLLFEMIAGRTPFLVPDEDIDQMTLFKRIIRAEYRFPHELTMTSNPAISPFSMEAMRLIKELLVSNKSKRLGNLSNGVNDILRHDWFNTIDFERLKKKQIAAPFVPSTQDYISCTPSFSCADPKSSGRFGVSRNREHHEFSNDEKDEFFWFKLSDDDQANFKTF